MALSMRRIFSVIAVTALMVAMMVAMAMPAFALKKVGGNPTGKDNPYAGLYTYPGVEQGVCVDTYKSEGTTAPPKSAAKGGNPGSDYNQTAGVPGCPR